MDDKNKIIEELQKVSKFADDLYSAVMNCLDNDGHSEDCMLFNSQLGNEEKWCTCWRAKLQIIVRQYMP